MKKLSIIYGLMIWVGVASHTCADNVQKPQFFYAKDSQDLNLRGAFWPAQEARDHAATIVFLQGRASFIEKNQDLMIDLARMGFHVYTLDLPGQGGSTRFLSQSQKGYVDDFKTYLVAIDNFLKSRVYPNNRGPLIIMGVSLGGHLGLRLAKEYPGRIKAVIAVAPMLDVNTQPYPKCVARAASFIAHTIGAGAFYAFGYGDYNPTASTFEKNKETSDKARYLAMHHALKTHPHFVTGGPTFSWVWQAFSSMDLTQNPSYLAGIKVPVLMISAGQDQIVDTSRDRQVCEAITNCHYKVFTRSCHNIPQERPSIRQAFLHQVDTFARTIEQETKP